MDRSENRPAEPAADLAGERNWLGQAALLVPVKDFSKAKLRLTPALSSLERQGLARRMATRVVRSAGRLPVTVVCDDREVADWARGEGALVLWEPGRGLNGAVQDGVSMLKSLGVARVVVAASDLPLVDDLEWLASFGGVTVVPDRREDGTNVLALPTSLSFSFSYGPGSFSRHLAEARALGASVRVVHNWRLAWDVDLPSDLGALDTDLLEQL